MSKKRLALIGCGKLNEIVADACESGALPEYELVGVLGRDQRKAAAFAERHHCKACASIDELLAEKPDFTAEAASVQAVRDYAQLVLVGGSNLVVLSIGAFADANFYDSVKLIAAGADRQVYIASGAVGGFDVLRTAALMGPVDVSFGSQKPPAVIAQGPLATPGVGELDEPKTMFSGTAAEAIQILPTHVNVAVAAALASAGPDNMQVEISAVPGFEGDEYKIELIGEEVKTDLNIYSRTSKVAGWSVVAALKNAVAPIVF